MNISSSGSQALESLSAACLHKLLPATNEQVTMVEGRRRPLSPQALGHRRSIAKARAGCRSLSIGIVDPEHPLAKTAEGGCGDCGPLLASIAV